MHVGCVLQEKFMHQRVTTYLAAGVAALSCSSFDAQEQQHTERPNLTIRNKCADVLKNGDLGDK